MRRRVAAPTPGRAAKPQAARSSASAGRSVTSKAPASARDRSGTAGPLLRMHLDDVARLQLAHALHHHRHAELVLHVDDDEQADVLVGRLHGLGPHSRFAGHVRAGGTAGIERPRAQAVALADHHEGVADLDAVRLALVDVDLVRLAELTDAGGDRADDDAGKLVPVGPWRDAHHLRRPGAHAVAALDLLERASDL